MAYWDFRTLVMDLDNIGFLDVLLPFVLIFTIVFAVLQKTKILGEENGKPRKNFNVIIALVMGLGAVIPHVTNMYPADSDVVVIINNALPQVSLLAVAIIMVLLTIGVFGKNMDIGQSKVGGWFVLGSILIIAFIFASAAGLFDRAYLPSWLYFIYDSQFQALVVAIVVFGLIIAWITSDDSDKGSKSDKPGFIEELKKTLK